VCYNGSRTSQGDNSGKDRADLNRAIHYGDHACCGYRCHTFSFNGPPVRGDRMMKGMPEYIEDGKLRRSIVERIGLKANSLLTFVIIVLLVGATLFALDVVLGDPNILNGWK